MRTVILVPRRSDGGHRDRVWEWVRARWASDHPDFEIVEGHHTDGLFNRSAAVNEAARKAGKWDVAVIIDADVTIHPDRVREAIAFAHDTGRMVLPFSVRRDLSQPGTQMVMDGQDHWGRYVARRYRNLVSCVVVVSRGLWDAIGGFDEAFRGWGAEDNAFAAAAETFGGPIARFSGDVWHLWHPAAVEGRKNSPSYLLNAARADRYGAATGNIAAIRELQAEIPVILAAPRELSVGIPRILHRVVPEITSPQADQWWAEFDALHPGWELRTHRDPLDPADWPLTAPHWAKAANGAQFADMIRLEALLRFGGIYVDQDVQPFRSLNPLLPLHAFAAWENERCVPNAVMGAVPGHPAIRTCLDVMLSRLPGPTWQAGPGVLTDVLPGRDDILLLGPESFYAVDYRSPDRAALMEGFKPAAHPAAFGLHWYWGSWLESEPRRRRVA